MKKREMFQKKLLKAVLIALPFVTLFGCKKEQAVDVIPAQDLLTFEREYSQSLNYTSDKSIKLIGFKKLKMDQEDLADFKMVYRQYRDKMTNYFYDKENATFRVHFPVEAALIEHNAALTEANELGELSPEGLAGTELYIVGRKQTSTVRGVEGNIIKDGIIYLAEKNKADHRMDNLYVFDFGYKNMMDHNHHSTDQVAEKRACMRNHGGPNCSNAFNIHKGRCKFNSRVCMDYNGWFTNCVNGKWSNFPGSDCDYALGRGHCWNEVM